MAKRERSIEQMRYEEALEQLETLIDRIESGEIGLEESLKEYETGMALIRRCRAILGTAEKKIAELAVDAEGQLNVKGEDGDLSEAAEDEEIEADAEDDDEEPPI